MTKGDKVNRGLRLVDGIDRPAGFRHLSKWLCRECEKDTGAASTVTVVAHLGGFIENGKYKPGSRHHVCAGCLARGKTTVVY